MSDIISLSLNSLKDKRILLILAKVMGLTLIAFVLFGIAAWFALNWALARWGVDESGAVAAIASTFLMLLGGWLLFRAIAVAITWVFADDIIDAVEDRFYPDIANTSTRPNFAQSLGLGLKSLLRTLGYNLLALPLYILFLITGIGTLVVFMLVNTLILGRDLEDMIMARHGKEKGRLGVLPRLTLGGVGTAVMLVPLLQIIVPVVATAAAVHITHRKFAYGKGQIR